MARCAKTSLTGPVGQVSTAARDPGHNPPPRRNIGAGTRMDTLGTRSPRRLGQALLLALGLASCGGGGGAGSPGGVPGAGSPPTADGTVEAPGAFADLRAETGPAPGQVVLRFTAPGG